MSVNVVLFPSAMSIKVFDLKTRSAPAAVLVSFTPLAMFMPLPMNSAGRLRVELAAKSIVLLFDADPIRKPVGLPANLRSSSPPNFGAKLVEATEVLNAVLCGSSTI